jgi:hypothetical protein
MPVYFANGSGPYPKVKSGAEKREVNPASLFYAIRFFGKEILIWVPDPSLLFKSIFAP